MFGAMETSKTSRALCGRRVQHISDTTARLPGGGSAEFNAVGCQSEHPTNAHKLFVSVWKLLNFEQRETPRLAPGDLEDQPFHADSWLVVHISKSVGILVGSPSFVGSSPARNPTEVYATDSML